MKLRRIILPIFCLCFLFGCGKTVEDNTTSNTTKRETTTSMVTKSASNNQAFSTQKVVWGPGNIVDHQQPTDPVNLQNQYSSLGGRWLLDKEKSVCLTFDEGYENGFTPSILDTLKEKKVKAIFFVTYDFAKDNPDLIKRMIDEGHIVGNHTYRHYTMDEVSESVAKEEVTYLHNYIKDNYDYTMSYFRFPKGEFSQQVLSLVNDLGYKSVFWSFAYADWDTNSQMDEAKAFTHICESTHNGEILLLHAVSETNAKILGKTIDDIRQQGYEFTVEI